MKRLLLAGILVLSFAGVSVAGDVQKLYLTGTSQDFNVSRSVSEVGNADEWNLEGRAKVVLYKGFGVDSSLNWGVGNAIDSSDATVGVFYQPNDWSEVSYSTTFGIDRFQDVGDVSVIKVSIGKGF
ncbi:MAG: hypothetical protein V3R78_10085 [Thermodesulfobacteriota bacterium]